jgi:ribose transport system permease protein
MLPDAFLYLGQGNLFHVPVPLLIVAALAAATHVVLSRTLTGGWLYAIGLNVQAARISGVPVRRVTILAYAASGLFAAVASMLLTARLETGSPTQGQGMLLDVIGATVIGGTSLFGGRGKVLWTVTGVLLFTLISNTLNLFGLSDDKIMIVKGCVILVAATLDWVRHRAG